MTSEEAIAIMRTLTNQWARVLFAFAYYANGDDPAVARALLDDVSPLTAEPKAKQ